MTEFHRPVRVEPLPKQGVDMDVEASPEEREALARLNNLQGVARVSAHFEIRKWRRGVSVTGRLQARVTQTCVVSLEPFEAEIDVPFDVKFLPAEALEHAPAPAEGEDEPDPIVDGRIDLGALASEFMTLSLDPYPRKPDAAFDASYEDAERASPFAPLGALNRSDETG